MFKPPPRNPKRNRFGQFPKIEKVTRQKRTGMYGRDRAGKPGGGGFFPATSSGPEAAGPMGFSDWNYLWDMTRGDTTTPGAIPAEVGGVDWTLLSGSYSRGTYPPFCTIDGIGLDAAAAGPITCTFSEFDVSGLTDLTGPVGGTHVRVAARRSSALAGALIVGNSFISGERIQISLNSGNVQVFVFDSGGGGGSLVVQHQVNHGLDDAIALDVHVYSEGSNTRLDLWCNGQYSTVTNGAWAWTGPTVARLVGDGFNGDWTGVGIRMTDTPVTEAEHRAFVNNWIDGMLAANRGAAHRFEAEDATSGSPWVDAVGAYSVPSAGVATVSTVERAGASAAAIGSLGARNFAVSSGVTPWQSSGDVALAQPAGTSIWVRVIARVPAGQDIVPHAVVLDFRDSAPTPPVRLDRFIAFTNAGGNGGGQYAFFDDGTNGANSNTRSGLDNRGEWTVLDYHYDSATHTTTMASSGVIINTAYTGASPASIWNAPFFNLLRDANIDLIFFEVRWGADADAYSDDLHNADVALLEATV